MVFLLLLCTLATLIVSGVSPVIAHAADAWVDTGFLYRKKITFSNGSSTTDLTNFPVAIVLTSANIDYSKTQNSGQDIRFTDSNGTTTIQYEIEKWNESGTSTVWIKVPQINGTSTSDYVYMYYGSSTAVSTASSSAVWDSGFVGVWHYAESPSSSAPQAQDSTTNNNDGRSAGSMTLTDLIEGQTDGAWDFDGTDDYASSSDSSSLDILETITVEAWVNPINFSTDYWIVSKGDYTDATNNGGYALRAGLIGGRSNELQFNVMNNDLDYIYRSNIMTTSSWQHIVGTWNGTSTFTLYRNGTSLTASGTDATISSISNRSEPLLIGQDSRTGFTSFFPGGIDEVRVSNVVRSADWVLAEYKTGANEFNTFASEEPAPTVSFSLATSSASESATTTNIEIVLSAVSAQNIGVLFSVVASSTATGDGADYSGSSGLRTITAGNTTTSINIEIINDSLDEADETIVFQLATSTNAILGTSTQHVYTIQDNDAAPTIQFSLATSTGSEATATATIGLVLSTTSSLSITVQYSVVASSTATGSGTDYTLTNGTSTISAGNTTTSIQIPIVNDSLDEVDETIVIQLATSTNATLATTTEHIYTITDDDSTPTIYFASSSSSYTESAVNATLILSLSATSSLSITVQYRALSTSTATGSGTDFTLSDGTSTISAGNSTTSISVTLIDDSSDESDEIIYLNIHTPTNATAGSTSTHTLTITDNDESDTGSRSGGGGGGVPSYVLSRLPPPTIPSSPSIPPPSVSPSPSFLRSLELGDTGPDVKSLQIFLNQNGFTISESGPGSKGNETERFGSLTKNALIKFQEKYKDDILTPSGLTRGTGYLGPKTIAFMKSFNPENTEQKKVTPPTVIVEKKETEKKSEISSNFFHRSLKLGMEGEDVRLLQETLAKNKNIYPEGVISGYFGPLTEGAVKKLQLTYKITTLDDNALGFVGPKTRNLLNVLVSGE